MTVGVDTYVTVAEADVYISSHYRKKSADRQRWDTLLDEDKKILLVTACTEIELLPFLGRKAGINQMLAFPRLPFQYYRSQDPPADVKAAQVELALFLSDDDTQSELDKRRRIQEQGVVSFRIDDLSENYAPGVTPKPIALTCTKTAALLARYLNGGYATC